MRKILDFVVNFIVGMKVRDMVLILMYAVVYVILGILMKVEVIPYPKTIMELWNDTFESTGLYGLYCWIFIIVTITNGFAIWTFLFSEDGFRMQFKKWCDGYWDYSMESMIGSLITLLVVMTVNVFLFPIFLVLYIIIGVAIICFLAAGSK